MDIQLARIDDRLIHGQVATAWTKETGVNRIIVVSDDVAKDPLRKFMLQEAAPPGVKANVVTVGKLLSIYTNQLLANQKIMLLFTNPQDVVALIRGGVQIPSVNIGGMHFVAGKKMITNFVSVDERDITAFCYLDRRGVVLEVRKVPADRKVFLMDLLKKHSK
ncbi:mannose/fructose/sorbose PTS transporter subunit IIB [Enterococcus sp. LJL98]